MKITIEKGQTVQEVLRKLEKFFEENADCHAVLKNDANLYINLCLQNGEEHFANYNDYRIGKEETYCEEEALIAEVKSGLMNYMVNTAYASKKQAMSAFKETAKAERYLRQAKEKGLSTVAKWEEKLQKAKEYEKAAPKYAEFYTDVLYCIENGKINWEYVIEKDSSSLCWTYKILPIIDSDKDILKKTLYFTKNGFSTEKPPETSWLWGTKQRKRRNSSCITTQHSKPN